VEDAAGLRLAATKTEGTVDYTSQTRESYIDPKEMPPAPIPPCKIADITVSGKHKPHATFRTHGEGGLRRAVLYAFPFLQEIIDKNRTGLSYDMIFLHGKKEDYNPHVGA
jgi:hypothetical protein